VGRYQLLAKLGEGGMGVVHLARGPDGNRFALKVLRDHVVADDEGRSRLAREVTTLRRVRSRRVAEVYDADPWGERPFIVTRYVPGRSLHDHVKHEGPLAGRDLRFLALGLAEAMVAVHDAGVVHRDIKPSNVLLEGRAPVLIDFGLAKLADDSRLTVAGFLMGTPGYLAPEVLYGDEPTPASDVHAWAATVVYAASGTSPYGAGPSMAVMDRARRGEYDVGALPTDLRPLIARSLSADPDSRPSGTELVARLNHLQDEPVAPALTADAAVDGVVDPGPMTAPLHRPLPSALHPVGDRQARPQAARPLSAGPPPVTPHATPRAAPRQVVGTTRPLTVPVREDQPAPRQTAQRRSGPTGALRFGITLGLGAAVATAVGFAPYVASLTLLVLVWLLRTASVSNDAHLHRQARRGARRSDGLVRVLASPWHLFVAMWGSAVLLGCAALAAVAIAGSAVVIGEPTARSVLLGGVAFTLVLWWGPASRRVRHRTQRLVWRLASPDPAGVGWLLLVWLVAVILAIARFRLGVVWAPDTGPPFDPLPQPLDPAPWWPRW
jgi:predicted Ser/Thr protein kinase